MSFAVFGDSGCNIPKMKLDELDIHIVPFSYELDGEIFQCPESPDGFDGHAYYDKLRNGSVAKTSLLSTGAYEAAFRPFVEKGMDIIYVVISSGISGTMGSALIAAEALMEEFPERRIEVVDSMGAGLGTGLLVMRAADLRKEGMDTHAAAEQLREEAKNLCEFFTVDDLMFLRRTGRVSGASAAVGTMLKIKPILRGDEEGHIVVTQKLRGRKKAVDAIVSLYESRVVDAASQRVAISHGDCLQDALEIAARVRAIAEPKELIIATHEPLTGAHVGPGMLALFFFSDGR